MRERERGKIHVALSAVQPRQPVGGVRCWFCSTPRPGATEIAATPWPARRSVAPIYDEDHPSLVGMTDFQRRLPGLTLGWIVSVCLLLILFYGVGLALLVVSAPALYRLYGVVGERSPSPLLREHETAWQTCALVFAAIGIVLLVVVSSLITLWVCAPTGAYALIVLDGKGFALEALVWMIGLLVGMAAAGGLGYGIVYALFPRKKRE